MKKTIAVLNKMVRDGAIEDYAIAGAIGATFYVEPFATEDLDVLVVMPSLGTGLIAEIPGLNYLRRQGFTEMRGEAIVIEDWPVQFIPVSDQLTEEAYLNADTVSLEGVPTRVVLAEHLVAIMLKVGRPKDVARIQMFLSQEAVNRESLSEILERHRLGEKWEEFQRKAYS